MRTAYFACSRHIRVRYWRALLVAACVTTLPADRSGEAGRCLGVWASWRERGVGQEFKEGLESCAVFSAAAPVKSEPPGGHRLAARPRFHRGRRTDTPCRRPRTRSSCGRGRMNSARRFRRSDPAGGQGGACFRSPRGFWGLNSGSCQSDVACGGLIIQFASRRQLENRHKFDFLEVKLTSLGHFVSHSRTFPDIWASLDSPVHRCDVGSSGSRPVGVS